MPRSCLFPLLPEDQDKRYACILQLMHFDTNEVKHTISKQQRTASVAGILFLEKSIPLLRLEIVKMLVGLHLTV